MFRTASLLFIALLISNASLGCDDQLDRILRSDSKAEIHQYFNNLKQSHISNDDVEVLEAALQNLETTTSLEASPLIRVHLVDLLLQAYRNGRQVDPRVIENQKVHIIDSVHSNDLRVSRTAMSAIALFDTPDDFRLLIEIAELENDATFRSAVSSVVSMCLSYDSQEFDRFLNELSNSNAKIAKGIRDSFIEFAVEVDWCNRN